MADDRKGIIIKETEYGQVRLADEVVAIIAGLAATEVEGVASMAGDITKELIARLGMKNLSRGVHVEYREDKLIVYLALNIAYGYSIPEVTANVQNRVSSTIRNMAGLEVKAVHIRIADVDVSTES